LWFPKSTRIESFGCFAGSALADFNSAWRASKFSNSAALSAMA
jgi:hypothetical protein